MKFAYRWHGRIGSVLAPLLALSALSGACLLWLQPLPTPLQEPPAPAAIQAWARALDLGLAQLAREHPGTEVDLVELPRQAGASMRVHLRGADASHTGWVVVDAEDGRAADLQPDDRDVRTLLLHLHEHLLLQGPGEWVLRAAALAGLAALTLGMRIWWRVRKLQTHLPWRRWHRRVGAVAALPLSVMLATGLVLRSPELARSLLANVDGGARAAEVAPPQAPDTMPPASAGTVLSAAARALPDARPVRLYAAHAGVVRVRMHADEWNLYGMHNVYVRAADAAVLRVVRPQDLPPQARYLDVIYPLHAGWLLGQLGATAGLLARVLWTLLALSLAWMAVSGAWSRWRPQATAPRAAQK